MMSMIVKFLSEANSSTLWLLRSFPVILPAYCIIPKTSLAHAAYYMRDDYRRPSRSLC